MTRLLLFVSIFIFCLCFESVRPLRIPSQKKLTRIFTNLSFGAMGWVVIGLLFVPILLATSLFVQKEGIGIIPNLPLAYPIRFALTILSLDYTLYVWHWMNHRIPFLWRFHLVHHVDLDLDVSTASRFHVGELLWSVLFRLAQITIIGVDPFTLSIFEAAITSSAQFHHSNIRLPITLERWLNRVIVTPRMHGIHHSIIYQEVNSNFSTIFSFWDRIHRSLRLNIHNSDIVIGVDAYQVPAKVTLVKSLLLPLKPPPVPNMIPRPTMRNDQTHMVT